MATEALRKVRDTEEKAEDLIHSAYDEADRILADARSDAARMVDGAQNRVRREVTFIRSSLDKEANEEIQALQARSAAEREKIHQVALARIEEAVRTVLEKIGIEDREGQAG